MNKYFYIYLVLTIATHCQGTLPKTNKDDAIPIHQIIIVVASGCLLAVALFLYLRYRTAP